MQKGRHQFNNHPSWAEDQCETIQFQPFIFYPDNKIFILLSVNHVNYSDPAYVHEATAPWVERVNSTQFTACVTRAGRNDYPSDSFASIDWIAYQGAPSGGVTGEETFSRWWTGTSCRTVTLPSVSLRVCCLSSLCLPLKTRPPPALRGNERMNERKNEIITNE